jgi:hypothetical protein
MKIPLRISLADTTVLDMDIDFPCRNQVGLCRLRNLPALSRVVCPVEIASGKQRFDILIKNPAISCGAYVLSI